MNGFDWRNKMFTLSLSITSLTARRRQVEALKREFRVFKRRYARVIAAVVLKSAADQLSKFWEIALAKKNPPPTLWTAFR